MCNEIARRIELGLVRDDFAQLRIPLRFPEGLPNFQPLDSIRITDTAAIVKQGAEPELVMRRWSWPGPGGKPVYNFRSEGRRFASGRCLVIADGFYEFTSPADPKAKRKHKWEFQKAGEDWFGIAGLVRPWGESEAFTMLTTEPGPDVAPYHSRQIVVLERADWGQWLDPQASAEGLLRPAPAGSFSVQQIC
jgi:putative SOS response-associated peptidase YedK